MGSIAWSRLPIQREDLPKIRELLTAEEYENLLNWLEGGSLSNSWLADSVYAGICFGRG